MTDDHPPVPDRAVSTTIAPEPQPERAFIVTPVIPGIPVSAPIAESTIGKLRWRKRDGAFVLEEYILKADVRGLVNAEKWIEVPFIP